VSGIRHATSSHWARHRVAPRDYVWVRYIRNDCAARTYPADRREWLVTAYSVAVLLAFVVGAFVIPPDPVTQVRTFPVLFVGTFVLSAPLIMRDSVANSSDSTV